MRFRQGLFNMTSDSNLFKTAVELEENGFYRVKEFGQPVFKKSDAKYLRLYEGKMVQMYDHRAANVVVNPANVHRPAQQEPATPGQHADMNWTPEPQFWIPEDEVQSQIGNIPMVLGFKGITAPTNMRTIIPALHPYAGFGNSLFMLLPEDRQADFLSQSILPPKVFEQTMGGHKLSGWIAKQVLELTYVSEDMRPFAESMGYSGDPFAWDEERRQHLMARLDALFFHLYGVGKDAAAYILDTFPIVRRHDEKQFGRYRTKDMILTYMNAVAAGDMDASLEA